MTSFIEAVLDWLEIILLVFIVNCIALIPWATWQCEQEKQAWDPFLAKHGCKIVDRITGGTLTEVGDGMTADGKLGTVVAATRTPTPSKTGYLCSDGAEPEYSSNIERMR